MPKVAIFRFFYKKSPSRHEVIYT